MIVFAFITLWKIAALESIIYSCVHNKPAKGTFRKVTYALAGASFLTGAILDIKYGSIGIGIINLGIAISWVWLFIQQFRKKDV